MPERSVFQGRTNWVAIRAVRTVNWEALDGLEQRPAVRYAGVWRNSDQYAEGALCTHDGSLWIAKEDSRGVRHGSTATWQLIVKRGTA